MDSWYKKFQIKYFIDFDHKFFMLFILFFFLKSVSKKQNGYKYKYKLKFYSSNLDVLFIFCIKFYVKILKFYKHFWNHSFNGNSDINNIYFQVVSLFVKENKMQNLSYLCFVVIIFWFHILFILYDRRQSKLCRNFCLENAIEINSSFWKINFYRMSIVFVEWITISFRLDCLEYI